jgi:transporter family-2 protein
VLGVIVVSASNVVLPRIPVVSVTALLFVGQMAAGLVIDGLARGAPDLPRLSGAVLVLAGLLVNLAIDRRTAARARTGTPPSAA